ncbi:MAG: Lrp/AsnC family transcriptional regulator [Candidatus Bathyarchaeaceae archaeon]
MSQKLDEVDRKIIEALRKDARTPFTEISKNLGISDATVHFRVKKMLKTGIIKKYTIVADESVDESRISCYMLMKVKHGKIDETSKQLIAIERISIVQEVHGSNDIILRIGTNSLEGLRNIITKIQENPNVITSEYFTIIKTWKE